MFKTTNTSMVNTNTENNGMKPGGNKGTSKKRKQCEDNSGAESAKQRPVRILARRYALTRSGSKYLELGINAGVVSYVEIAVGNQYGHEVILSLVTWKELLEVQQKIQRRLRKCDEDAPHAISVGPLTVQFEKMDDIKLIKLVSADACLAMTKSTLYNMYRLDNCVEIMYKKLNTHVDKVSSQFIQYSDIVAKEYDSSEVADTIRNSYYFSECDIIDCELLALAFTS